MSYEPGQCDTAIKRLLHLAFMLGQGRQITTAYIRETYGVSIATAKRDLVRLECALPVTVRDVAVPGPHPQKVLTLGSAHQ